MGSWKRFAAVAAVASGLLLSGCGSSGLRTSDTTGDAPTDGGPLVSGGATTMYVVQNNTYITGSLNASAADVIMAFPASANGNVATATTLTTPTGVFVTGLTTDAAGNLYVGGLNIASFTGEILVYATGASGTAVPTRTIVGTSTGLAVIQGITVDTAGQIYVSSWTSNGSASNSISVFANGATGNVAPIRTISGGATGLTSPAGLAVDSAGTIYVADAYSSSSIPGHVSAFTSTQSGNVTPARSFTTLYAPVQIAIDSSNNLYLPLADATGSYGAINVFPSTTSGSFPSPAKIIGGYALGARGGVLGVTLDSRGNLYYVYLKSSSSATPAIGTYGPTATGNATPATSVTSNSFTYNYFGYIAVH